MGISIPFQRVLPILLIASLLSGCAASAATPQMTETIPSTTTEPTVEAVPLETLTPTSEPASTSTPPLAITATSLANAMKADMQKLANEKLVSSPYGKYYRVQDFTGEYAKLAYYRWWSLDRQPTNFAIRAVVTWDSAMPNANPSKAGCGFVFHETGVDNLHFSLLTMDGYVRNYRVEKKIFNDLKANYAGKFKIPADSAKIMLVVNYQWITIFVNDKQIVRFQDDHLKGGGLGFGVASGSNNDFGTRCEFTNVELWEFN
ncbi:MAG: hypothetical protein GYA15_07335 [Leptolinea sp.]|jgi:hypothetical protein|nr:hypothetical protein [Leptolinea sp.]